MKRNQYWALEIPLGDLRAFTHHGDRRIRLFSGGDSGGGGGEVDSVIGEVGSPTGVSGVDAVIGEVGSPSGPVGSSPSMDTSGGSADIAGLNTVSAPAPAAPAAPATIGPASFDPGPAMMAALIDASSGSGGMGTVPGGPTATNGLDAGSLQALSSAGFGNMDISPSQTVGQALASLNTASTLNKVAPYAMAMMPGLTTAVTLQGLLSGKGFVNPLDVFTAAVNNQQEQAQSGMGGTTGFAGMDYGGGGDGGYSPEPTPTVAPALASATPEMLAGGAGGGVNAPYGGPMGGLRFTYNSPGAAGASGAFGMDDEEERRRRGELPRFEEGGMIGPGGMPMIGGAPRAGVQQAAPQAAPQGMMQQVQQFVQQHPQQVQEIQQEILSGLQSGELQPQVLNRVVQLVQVVEQNPEMYPYVRNFLIQQDIVDEGDLPPQFNEGVVFLLGVIAEAAKSVSGSAGAMAGMAPPVESLAQGGNVPDSAKRSGGVIIEAHEGEYVIPAHIVRQKGTDFFDKLIGKDAKAEKGAA